MNLNASPLMSRQASFSSSALMRTDDAIIDRIKDMRLAFEKAKKDHKNIQEQKVINEM